MAWTPPSDAIAEQAPSKTPGITGWKPPSDAVEIQAKEAPAAPAAPAVPGPTPGMVSMINEPKPAEPKKVFTGSVFDTQPFEPPFNPEEATRLSRRAYAEQTTKPPARVQEMRATPQEQIERSELRAAGDTAIGVLQGAVAIPKGITENIPFDNPLSQFYKDAYQAGEQSKSGYLRSKNAERAAMIDLVRQNQGELAATRAAFNTMFSPAGADIVAQGTGSLIPALGMSTLDLGAKSMMAMNALANAGDAAQSTAARLAEMSPQDWSNSAAYQSLRKQGMDHRDAVRMLAPIYALPSQVIGGISGAISGSTGLERTLVGGAARTARGKIGRAGAEVLGEEFETLAPALSGNITQRIIDDRTAFLGGLGQAAVETAAAAGPGAALAAGIPATERKVEPSAERMARERGFLVEPAKLEAPATEATAIEAAAPQAATQAAPQAEDQTQKLLGLLQDLEATAGTKKPAQEAPVVSTEAAIQEPIVKPAETALPTKILHGTSPENKEAILESNKFAPIGQRQYSYSQFGRQAVYFSPEEGWWLNKREAEAGRAAVYPEQVQVRVDPSANIAVVNSVEDLDKLAKQIGLADGQDLMRNLDVDGLDSESYMRKAQSMSLNEFKKFYLNQQKSYAPPEVSKRINTYEDLAREFNEQGFAPTTAKELESRAEKTWRDAKKYDDAYKAADATTQKLLDAGIDGIYVAKEFSSTVPEEGFGSYYPAPEQLAMFNTAKVKPITPQEWLDSRRAVAEEMEGVPAPLTEEAQAEVEKLTADQEAALAAREEMSKRTAGTSLMKVLKGTLNDGELSELGGRARQVGKNLFLNLKAPKGQRGSSMEDMVESGKLDLFLPEDMRPGHPSYENTESAEYIREKLRNNEFYTYETERSIARVDEDIESIERQIQELLSEDEINKEIQYATNEQRELDQAAAELAPEEEAGVAEKRAGEEEILKTQTEEELQAKAEREQESARKEEAARKEEERKAAAPKAEEFVLTGSERAADEAAARGQQTFLSISRPVSGEPSKRAPSVTRRAKTLRRQRDAGKISDMEFVIGVNAAIDAAEMSKYAKDLADRVRGADFIRQKLLEAKRKGWLSKEAVDLAEWFINKNPSLVDDLAIAIKSPKESGVAGRYFDFPRIMVLMKESGTDDTIVHEILHHLERMMPPDIRSAIRKEWAKQLANAKKSAKTDNEKNFFELLDEYHYGTGVEAQFKAATTMLQDGMVPIEFYQYVNPSEFWAVNGSDIVSGRFDAIRGGLLQRLKNWLKELGQKMKSLFGLQSSAPIIRALDSLAKADGKFVSNKMLLEEAPEFASVKGKKEEPKPVTKKGVEDTWLFGRDKSGKVGFGPGAKAYATVANIANNVLDKVYLKPVSPELGRALRNMKVKVDQVQKKIGEVAAEMNKMSPDERVMISDIIEGELKAGVHPPQHVLNLAAAIQSMMSRQSQELVDLGMLSKEAANRWDNKYLPRFYERNLKNNVNAWAKAAREVFMKQPMMRGIKGSSLRARGLFEVIDTADLQDWVNQGWEQRDPNFDPKKSEKTIVWRDYTKQEREDMGEIRDAMFRFVMGYNASQRDIALGRLYRDLSKNYASDVPQDGYVQVPDSKAEGTFAPKYGELAGKYVPKEIMDHLSANDHAMAEGVLKIYRAGLSKWKEGKTVLNPVSHANNVISNLTMAHFAGVSYWDTHKYAGAIKDLVKKDPMIKEADEVGLFGGSFNQSELVKSMPPELRAMANMTDSQLSRFGERIWDLFAYTVEVGGRKYGARPVMQWAYENEDLFFRYLIYRDARNRGMDPEAARDYSQEYIFTYDDLPKGARALRDYGMPFFSYTYKVVPVLARTALVYPWRYAAPATIAYTANALMYAMAANLGADEDDWWGKVLYKYVTDPEFRKRANEIETEERKHLPEWLKGSSAILSTPKAIRMGMDEATNLPIFLDISRIFPGGDLLDANNNAGGLALLQPLTPSNPVLTTLVAMLANKDMFLGKDVTKKTDTDEEKARKRAEWLWKQATPAISVGNYHFDRAMNVVANYTGKPITIDAGPMGVTSYTGVGKDGLPVQPKHAMLQTMGIKIRPYDLEISKGFDETAKRQIMREIDFEISRINRQEGKGIISAEAARVEREKLIKKKVNIAKGLTLGGEEKD